MNQIFLETRMFRLSDGEEIMTLAFFVLIQYRSVMDRRTDIPPLAIPAVCIARYANALVKIGIIDKSKFLILNKNLMIVGQMIA